MVELELGRLRQVIPRQASPKILFRDCNTRLYPHYEHANDAGHSRFLVFSTEENQNRVARRPKCWKDQPHHKVCIADTGRWSPIA